MTSWLLEMGGAPDNKIVAGVKNNNNNNNKINIFLLDFDGFIITIYEKT